MVVAEALHARQASSIVQLTTRSITGPHAAMTAGPMTELQDTRQAAPDAAFLRHDDSTPEDIPVLVRGDGCHIYDDLGNRYIDGLSGLYCTNLGHSHGEEIGAAAAAQMATLPVHDATGRRAHPPSIELAAKLAELAPAGFERSVLHLGRLRVGRVRLQDGPPVAPGQRRADAQEGDRAPRRLPRDLAGSALVHRHPGLPDRLRAACRSRPRTSPRRTPTATPPATTRPPSRRRCSTEIEEVIEFERPETIAMIIMEPVQNAGWLDRPARRATGTACARSATATGSCSSPTR